MKEEMVREIQTYLEDNGEVSPPVLWDVCKAVLRRKIIAKSAYLKRLKQKKLDALQSDLKMLQRQLKHKLDDKSRHEIKKIK